MGESLSPQACFKTCGRGVSWGLSSCWYRGLHVLVLCGVPLHPLWVLSSTRSCPGGLPKRM